MRVYWRIYSADARTVILVIYVNTILSLLSRFVQFYLHFSLDVTEEVF